MSLGNEEIIPATACREERTRAAISNEPGELPLGGIAPECVRFQDGLIMYRDGLVPKREAAVIAEMRESTFVHRKDFHKSRHLLKEEEVEVLIWRYDIL